MKKIVIASVLATVGMAVSSYGQGNFAFQNYNFGATSLNAPVTFATSGVDAADGNSAVTAGWGVGSSFTADFLFEYGTMTSYVLGVANSGSQVTFTFGSPSGPVDTTSTFAGYFFGNGGVANDPSANYAGGSVNIIIEAYNGSSYANSVGVGMWRGQSAVITTALATGTGTPTDLAFSGFTVATVVPEPTTLALAGLGGLALLAFRRKQS